VCFWAANSGATFFICVLFNYFSLGGLFAVFPKTVISVFGGQHGPQIYVLVLLGSFLSSVLNLLATKLILPATTFLTLFMMGNVTTVLCLTVLYFYEEKLDVENLARWNAVVRKNPPADQDEQVEEK